MFLILKPGSDRALTIQLRIPLQSSQPRYVEWYTGKGIPWHARYFSLEDSISKKKNGLVYHAEREDDYGDCSFVYHLVIKNNTLRIDTNYCGSENTCKYIKVSDSKK